MGGRRKDGLNTYAGWHICHLGATGVARYPASVVNPSCHAGESK